MAIITGNGSNDNLIGTGCADLIFGLDGSDTLWGGAGNDTIFGGTGNDTIYGGTGNDQIYGGTGNDWIDGGTGNDYISGGDNDDQIYGGTGNDWIGGGTGNDTIYGGDGNDTIYGGDGNDWMDGGAGNDFVSGGDNGDTIYGGTGNDWIDGGKGNDMIYGDDGNDTIFGGKGNDTIYGGAGNDTIYGDNLYELFGWFHNREPGGNDYIEGGIGNDRIFGGRGNDEIRGGDGNDKIYGDNWFDWFDRCDWHHDGIPGGNDTLYGGAGNDTIFGGAGDDKLIGGEGADRLTGGDGDDLFVYLDPSDSPASDVILDFTQGEDTIDLSALLGPDGLTWAGTTPTMHGVWHEIVGNRTLIRADTTGDLDADVTIELTGNFVLTSDDFIGVVAGDTNENDNAPVLTVDNDPVSLSETAAAGAIAGADADATDADLDTITFSLVGAPTDGTDPLFAIDSGTGEISLTAAGAAFIDYETTPSYTLTVKAADGLGAHDQTKTVTLAMDNVDEVAPTITSGATAADIDENSGAGQVVYDANATDSADISAGVTFSLKAVDDFAAFSIDGGTGAVTLTANPDFEGKPSYSFTVLADDGVTTPAEQAVSLAINDVNDAPTLTAMSAVVDSVSEDRIVEITFADIAAQGNENDVDGTVVAFVVKAVSSGTLAIGTSSGTAAAWASGTNDTVDSTKKVFWTGPLNANGTLNAFTVAARDDGGLESESPAVQVQVNVTAVNDMPYIVVAPAISYWTDNGAGNFSAINRVSFQDADAGSTLVRVTLDMSYVNDDLTATTGGGVVVSGSGTDLLTLDGTIADINAFLFGGNVQWDPGTPFQDGTLTVTIDDNGAAPGGNVVSRPPITIGDVIPVFDNDSTNNFSSVNFTDIDTDPNGDDGIGDGDDAMITSWSHQPLTTDPNGQVVYDGGAAGTDSVTLVMTPDQLAAILASEDDQNDLRDYFDGDPSSDTLLLSDTAWNADVQGFEVANIALATGYGVGTYSINFNSFFDPLPLADTAPDADADDDLVIGTSENNSLNGGTGAAGLNGDDVLVGLGGNDSMDGGSGADLLLGGDGDDTLTGGTGRDVLSGGRGADTFDINETGTGNVDFLIDYSFVEGDIIDLGTLLDGAFDPGDPIADFVRLAQSANGALFNITVRVDIDGGGNSFSDVATLVNYGTTGNTDIVQVFFESTDVDLFA